MSRRPFRGAAVAGAPLEVPLRPPAPEPPPPPDSPEALMAAARARVEAMLAGARSEAEAMRAAAVAEGLAEGRAQAMAQAAEALAAVEGLAGALERRCAEMEEQAVREATALAVEVAARLVRAEVAARPERVADVLRAAIRRAADRSRLVARVHPDDLATCREAAPGILERMGGIGGLEVVDDPRVDRGSCILETPGGDVDATFQSQLGRVLEALAAPADESLVAP